MNDHPISLPRFIPRNPKAHKGDMGRILIVAGSRMYFGAAVLAATAALRGGAGLVHLAFPHVLYDCYASRLTEIILHPMPATATGSLAHDSASEILKIAESMDTAAVGPGLSVEQETCTVAAVLYSKLHVPSVFDADGLNALAKIGCNLSEHAAPRVLTPHPGEFSRLASKIEMVGDDRLNSIALAKAAQSVIVYKSATPVVANSTRSAVVTSGSAALATAGTGDVLTGLISALLHRFDDPYDAALLATHIHGRAGALAEIDLTQECVIASDLFTYIPRVFAEILNEQSER